MNFTFHVYGRVTRTRKCNFRIRVAVFNCQWCIFALFTLDENSKSESGGRKIWKKNLVSRIKLLKTLFIIFFRSKSDSFFFQLAEVYNNVEKGRIWRRANVGGKTGIRHRWTEKYFNTAIQLFTTFTFRVGCAARPTPVHGNILKFNFLNVR